MLSSLPFTLGSPHSFPIGKRPSKGSCVLRASLSPVSVKVWTASWKISFSEGLTPHMLLHILYNLNLNWFMKAENHNLYQMQPFFHFTEFSRETYPFTGNICWLPYSTLLHVQKLDWEHREQSTCLPGYHCLGEKEITNKLQNMVGVL